MHLFLNIKSAAKSLGAAAAFMLGSAAFAQCPVIVTHSGANFQGGNFLVEAGMAEGEAAAASYTLNAGDFPLRVNLIEMIFATANTNVATTTAWEVFVYDGTPDTGVLLASYTSDDEILPHIHMGPGTNGTNVQFSIDPQDPEQVYVYDLTGTHTVTVGYRIVHHNSPPANPCTQAPAQTRNAFPTVDTDGLQQPARNWLYAINCGTGGLTAPAGWHSFSQLSQLFRPTGDWVIRFTYESTNPLQISDQPDDQIIQPGGTALFQVAATGSGNLSYQWYKGTTALPTSGSSHYIGAGTSSLVILNCQAPDIDTYHVVVSSACGTLTSNNAQLDFQGISVSGHVTLQNWSQAPTGQAVRFDVHAAGGFNNLASRTVGLNAAGNYTFSLPSNLSAGNYDIYAVSSHWLRKKLGSVTVPAGGASNVNFTLINGDVDGNNEIGLSDYGLLSAAYGTETGDANFNAAADLDGNGEIGLSDYGILSAGYGEEGD